MNAVVWRLSYVDSKENSKKTLNVLKSKNNLYLLLMDNHSTLLEIARVVLI